MFGLISGMFGLNRSSIEPGIRYSCYPLVVVFNILSWYRFPLSWYDQTPFYFECNHCKGQTKKGTARSTLSNKDSVLQEQNKLRSFPGSPY